MHTSNFKSLNTFEKRQRESKKICEKHKTKIPIIVEVNTHQLCNLKLDKNKYLTPYDLTVGQFLYNIRKRITIEPEQALFMFFNEILPASSDSIGNVYSNNKDADGFLYATISLESTFGYKK
jgi:GABA(A) receptor-associated protein